jgi:hypothetical protein
VNTRLSSDENEYDNNLGLGIVGMNSECTGASGGTDGFGMMRPHLEVRVEDISRDGRDVVNGGLGMMVKSINTPFDGNGTSATPDGKSSATFTSGTTGFGQKIMISGTESDGYDWGNRSVDRPY